MNPVCIICGEPNSGGFCSEHFVPPPVSALSVMIEDDGRKFVNYRERYWRLAVATSFVAGLSVAGAVAVLLAWILR